jgi:hypothetical protein
MTPEARIIRISELLQFINKRDVGIGEHTVKEPKANLYITCRGSQYGAELMEFFSFQLDEEDMQYLKAKYTPIYEEYLIEDKKKRLFEAELLVARLKNELNYGTEHTN